MGEAVSRRLAGAGARVAAWDIDGPGVRRVADSIQAAGQTAAASEVDVASPERVRAAVEEVVARLGEPSILVNCAGASYRSPLLETRIEDWRRVVSVNLDGPFHTTLEVGRRM